MTKIKRLLAICALALIAGTAACLLVSALYPVLRGFYDEVGLPHRRAYLGRDMSEWLKILALTNSTKEPLQIIQITWDRTSHIATAGLPLSYDSLTNYGFLDVTYATFHLDINGDLLFAASCRGSNGDCLLPFDTRNLNRGTNRIRVMFIISNRTNVEFIEATGPVTELIWTNGEKWTQDFGR